MRTSTRRTWKALLALLVWLAAAEPGWSFYNPQAGRWLSRDPMGERGGFNPYGFD